MPVAPGCDSQSANFDAGIPPDTGDIGWAEPAGAQAPATHVEASDEAAGIEPRGEVEAPDDENDKDLALFDQLAADLEAAMRRADPSSPTAPGGADEAGTSAKEKTRRSATPEGPDAPQSDHDADFDRLSQAHKTALFS